MHIWVERLPVAELSLQELHENPQPLNPVKIGWPSDTWLLMEETCWHISVSPEMASVIFKSPPFVPPPFAILGLLTKQGGRKTCELKMGVASAIWIQHSLTVDCGKTLCPPNRRLENISIHDFKLPSGAPGLHALLHYFGITVPPRKITRPRLIFRIN